jgi:hypothetical protein
MLTSPCHAEGDVLPIPILSSSNKTYYSDTNRNKQKHQYGGSIINLVIVYKSVVEDPLVVFLITYPKVILHYTTSG